jgi:transcriptional regulator with XRE-family HTH domain
MSKQRDYLTKKHLQYQTRLGETVTQKAFAEYLGFPPTTYSNYYNGNGKPTYENLKRMHDLWGDEVYDAFDVPPLDTPDPLKYLSGPLREATLEIHETLTEYKVSPDSPEGQRLQDEIMKKHGYDRIDTNSPDLER